MKAKITQVKFKSEWTPPAGGKPVFYYDVWLSHDPTAPFNIGVLKKDSLAVGQELEFDMKDASKRSIVKAKKAEGGYSGSSKKGLIVGAAINNATLLAAHGKIELSELKAVAERFVQLAEELEK